MADLRDQMQRGRRQAPPDDEALTRLVDLRERRRRNGRLLSAAVALAVTGAMVAGGFVVLGHRGGGTQVGGSGSTTGAPSTAPTAGGAAPSPTTVATNLVAAPGQFYFTEILAVYPDSSGTADVWYGQDGSGRAIRPNPEAPDGVEHTTWEAGHYPYGDDLSYLSTDPAVLLQQLKARGSSDGRSPQPAVTPLAGQEPDTGGLVRAIDDLLVDAPHFLPDQRQAAYEVLRSLPTAHDLGSTEDPGGRPADAIRITTSDGETTFYFDPSTRLFMSEQHEFTSEDPGVPSETWFVLIRSAGIVDSDTARPTDETRYFGDAEQTPTASSSTPGA